jgi:hypothetical protein
MALTCQADNVNTSGLYVSKIMKDSHESMYDRSGDDEASWIRGNHYSTVVTTLRLASPAQALNQAGSLPCAGS